MTQLLVSVRSAAEAEAAIRGGADWVDLKEPDRGPLGAVSCEVARAIVAEVQDRAPISAAAGELCDWPASDARDLLAVAGISQLKLGLSGFGGRSWHGAWLSARRETHAAGKDLVAVIYADAAAAKSPAPLEVAALAGATGSRWLLIDTFDKRGGNLFDHQSALELNELFQFARGHGVTTAAAGRLTAAAIAALPLNVVDVVAVRSAACGGDRGGRVSAESVATLRQLVRNLAAVSQAYADDYPRRTDSPGDTRRFREASQFP
ncbi:MAG: hypothetical protein JNL18_02050 [Planctomycetaceae bacterium]|nr:hypothetical protein [Planctomycetaceae bacterium]